MANFSAMYNAIEPRNRPGLKLKQVTIDERFAIQRVIMMYEEHMLSWGLFRPYEKQSVDRPNQIRNSSDTRQEFTCCESIFGSIATWIDSTYGDSQYISAHKSWITNSKRSKVGYEAEIKSFMMAFADKQKDSDTRTRYTFSGVAGLKDSERTMDMYIDQLRIPSGHDGEDQLTFIIPIFAVIYLHSLPYIKIPDDLVGTLREVISSVNGSGGGGLNVEVLKRFQTIYVELYKQYASVMERFAQSKSEVDIRKAHENIVAHIDYMAQTGENQKNVMSAADFDKKRLKILFNLRMLFAHAGSFPKSGYKSMYVMNFDGPYTAAEARKGSFYEFTNSHSVKTGSSDHDKHDRYGFLMPLIRSDVLSQNSFTTRYVELYCVETPDSKTKEVKDGGDFDADVGDKLENWKKRVTYKGIFDTEKCSSNGINGLVWLKNNEVEDFKAYTTIQGKKRGIELMSDQSFTIPSVDTAWNKTGSIEDTFPEKYDYVMSQIIPHLTTVSQFIAYHTFFSRIVQIAECIVNNNAVKANMIPHSVTHLGINTIGVQDDGMRIAMCGNTSSLYASKYVMRLVKRNVLTAISKEILMGSSNREISEEEAVYQTINATRQFNDLYIMVRQVDVMPPSMQFQLPKTVDRFVPVRLEGLIKSEMMPNTRHSRVTSLLSRQTSEVDVIQLLNACLLISDSTDNMPDNKKSVFQLIVEQIKELDKKFSEYDSAFDRGVDDHTNDLKFLDDPLITQEHNDQMMSYYLNIGKIEKKTNGFMYRVVRENIGEIGNGADEYETKMKIERTILLYNNFINFFLVRYVESLVHLALFMFPGMSGMNMVLKELGRRFKDTAKSVCDAFVTSDDSVQIYGLKEPVSGKGRTGFKNPDVGCTVKAFKMDLTQQRTLDIREEHPGCPPQQISLSTVIKNVKPLLNVSDREGRNRKPDCHSFHVIANPNMHDKLSRLVFQTRAGAFSADVFDNRVNQVSNILHNAAVVMHVVNIMAMFQNDDHRTVNNPSGGAKCKATVGIMPRANVANHHVEATNFYEDMYQKDDSMRQYSWKSLKDSIFALFVFHMFNRDQSYTPMDPDGMVFDLGTLVREISSSLNLSECFNHPVMKMFADPELLGLINACFGVAT